MMPSPGRDATTSSSVAPQPAYHGWTIIAKPKNTAMIVPTSAATRFTP
jgi:hypothetical protein